MNVIDNILGEIKFKENWGISPDEIIQEVADLMIYNIVTETSKEVSGDEDSVRLVLDEPFDAVSSGKLPVKFTVTECYNRRDEGSKEPCDYEYLITYQMN